MAKWLPRLVPILPGPETRAVISVMTRRPDKSSNLSPYRFAELGPTIYEVESFGW